MLEKLLLTRLTLLHILVDVVAVAEAVLLMVTSTETITSVVAKAKEVEAVLQRVMVTTTKKVILVDVTRL
jgi:hypothetical protein